MDVAVQVNQCEREMFPATYNLPAEFCPNDAEEESIFCSDHEPWEPDWDDIRKDALVGHDCE